MSKMIDELAVLAGSQPLTLQVWLGTLTVEELAAFNSTLAALPIRPLYEWLHSKGVRVTRETLTKYRNDQHH